MGLRTGYDYEAHGRANGPASDGTKAYGHQHPQRGAKPQRLGHRHKSKVTFYACLASSVLEVFRSPPIFHFGSSVFLAAWGTWTSTICSIVLRKFLAYSCLINIYLRSLSVTSLRLFRIGNAPYNLLLRWCCAVDMRHPSDGVSCIS